MIRLAERLAVRVLEGPRDERTAGRGAASSTSTWLDEVELAPADVFLKAVDLINDRDPSGRSSD